MSRKLSRFARAGICFVLLILTHIAQADVDLGSILERGSIRVGVSLGAAPLGFYNERNEPSGYDVDMAMRLGDALGVDVELVDVYGDARVSMLVSGQLDVVVGNMTATLDRAKAVDFSIPYLRTGLRILVRKDSGIETFADLAEKKVVVGRGSSGALFLEEAAPMAELVYTDSFAPNGMLLLRQGRVDAAIEDNSILDFLATQSEDYELLPELYFSGPIAIGVAKDNHELLRWIDMFVSMYISSGEYESSFRKWWGPDLDMPELQSIW